MKRFYLLFLISGLLFFACSDEGGSTRIEHQLNISSCEISEGVKFKLFTRRWVTETKIFLAEVNKWIESIEEAGYIIVKIDWVYDMRGHLGSCMIRYKKSG